MTTSKTQKIRPADAARAHNVPEGQSGPWKVSKFEVESVGNQLGSMYRTGRFVPPGIYTRLSRNGAVIMSDTPDEIRDHHSLFRAGHGRVVVNGLGLGCAVRGLLAKDEVEHIDVVELSEDVIALVGPTFEGDPRVTIHQGDACTFTWPKGTRFDVAWHDIWDDLAISNLRGPGSYESLNRKYGRITEWQDAWGLSIVRAQRDREKREHARYGSFSRFA